MKNFLIWQRWLLTVSVLVLLFGIDMMLIPNLVQQLFDFILFGSERSTDIYGPAAYEYIVFIYGVVGAVMVGWMVLMIMIVRGPFKQGDVFGWNAVAYSAVSWFVLDSVFSAAAGFPENILLNTGFIVLFIIPLVATRKHFFGGELSSVKPLV